MKTLTMLCALMTFIVAASSHAADKTFIDHSLPMPTHGSKYLVMSFDGEALDRDLQDDSDTAKPAEPSGKLVPRPLYRDPPFDAPTDRAWWFYFGGRRRSEIDVVELSVVDGKLVAGDPTRPTYIDLKLEREQEN